MIEPKWRESGAPCDSCGEFNRNYTMTVVLTNKKAELGYGLPDLTMCESCRSGFRHEIAAHTPL